MKYLALLITLISFHTSTAQKITVNKKYNPSEIRTVSFTPYFDKQGNLKSNFNKSIEEVLSSTFTVCCQSDLEHNLINHEAFNNLAKRTIYSDPAELVQTKSNLYNSLTNTEKIELQKGCKNTDLIIITSQIETREVTKINGSGNISISGNITVFDLRTGEFVVSISDTMKKKYDNMRSASPPLTELVEKLVAGLNEALEN